MIEGIVEHGHPIVPVTFHRFSLPDLDIDFVVDTGFVGALTLPEVIVAELELSFNTHIPATLADDRVVQVPMYFANILWHGVLVEVDVLAMGTRPLLGVAMMDENRLTINCSLGGAISIEVGYR